MIIVTDQERRANEYANKILDELRAAQTPDECAAVSDKHAKAFARLQSVHPVRAIHVVNLASMKKREFEMEWQEQTDMFE